MITTSKLKFILICRLYPENSLKNKYEELNSWYQKMIDEPYNTRPDCKEILNKRYSWGLSKQEFDSEIDKIEKVIKERIKSEKVVEISKEGNKEEKKKQEAVSLVYFILQSKLKTKKLKSKISYIPDLKLRRIDQPDSLKRQLNMPELEIYSLVSRLDNANTENFD